MIALRDYQVEAIEALRAGMRAGHLRQILCAPTGSGKTIVAASLIEEAMGKGSRIAFVADRIALVEQTSLRLYEAGIQHGVIQGGNTYGRTEQVQVCSAQTLEKRGFWPGLDLVIIDEAHTQRKQTLQIILNTNKPVVGLTATPFSPGMGKTYSNIVNARTTYELIDDGWLVRCKVFCATEIDMTGARVNKMGEWSDADVERRAIPIVGDIVSEWVAHTQRIFGGPVKTLLFSPTVAAGEELCNQFNAAGYRFEQVSYRDKYSAGRGRRERIADFRAGRIDGLVSCEALAKGFDVPDALCLISARPYRKSLTGHIQQIGRIMRASPGKEFGLILDHSGNFLRHAIATESFWAAGCDELDDGEKKETKEMPKEQKERKCFECGFVMEPGADACGNCGAERKKPPPQMEAVAGQMTEYRSLSSEVGNVWPHICRLAVDRHPTDDERARKFALAQFKNITGAWPGRNAEVIPNDECDPRVELAVEKSLAAWMAKQRQGNYAKRAER